MEELKFDLDRTGFPIKIGALEFWFDASMENLRKFFNIEEIADEKLKEAQEKAKHVHFPKEVNEENIKDVDFKTVDAAFDLNKEFIAAQYDIIFGDGTFKKIYKKYPDVWALEKLIDPIGNAISKKIEQMEQERSGMVENKMNEYLNKKANKK